MVVLENSLQFNQLFKRIYTSLIHMYLHPSFTIDLEKRGENVMLYIWGNQGESDFFQHIIHCYGNKLHLYIVQHNNFTENTGTVLNSLIANYTNRSMFCLIKLFLDTDHLWLDINLFILIMRTSILPLFSCRDDTMSQQQKIPSALHTFPHITCIVLNRPLQQGLDQKIPCLKMCSLDQHSIHHQLGGSLNGKIT